MARVTKPTGRVIIIVPNTLCLWYKTGKLVAVMMKNFEFGYEEDYSPKRLKTAVRKAGLEIEKTFGLQALPPLATNDREIICRGLRKKIGRIENVFPYKQFYAYTVGIIARKPDWVLIQIFRNCDRVPEIDPGPNQCDKPVTHEQVEQRKCNCLFR